MNGTLDIRGVKDGDLHHLINIDRKGSEFPWDVEDWRIANIHFPEWRIIIATLDDEPVALALYEFNEKVDECVIQKLVAIPEAKWVLSMLLDKIEYGTYVQQLGAISFLISELECRGSFDPYDKSQWLKEHGFKWSLTHPNIYDAYGQRYDGYVFKKVIHGSREQELS